ncbi:MAG: outer membrane protein assembly factor BamC [Gammaproteobacteria bacterium]|nr:outer membrane protein assembly factor BamC [Gammaproteobacteria bacterium]
MPKPLVILSLALLLTGCNYLAGENGFFRDRADDYMEAPVLPLMAIPDELDSYTLDELYVIPVLLSSAEPFDEVPLPKPIETNGREGVIIQNLTDTSWIVLDATPGQVWPLVRDYWTQLQVILEYEDPGAGLMETSWLEVDSNLETRHKYRVTIEPGLHSGYSEIYVIHVESPRSEPAPLVTSWPETSESEDRERQILDSLSQYLADRNDMYQASSASLLAGSIEAERKANIVDDGQGQQVLELRLDYRRAWVLVRSALDEAGVTILENDRDMAFLNVRFSGISDDDKPGFIGRLFSRNSGEGAAVEQDFSVRLVDEDGVVTVIAEPLETADDLSDLAAELLLVINNNLT